MYALTVDIDNCMQTVDRNPEQGSQL